MNNIKLLVALFGLLITAASNAEVIELDYSKKRHRHDVFSETRATRANYSYDYMPYQEWLTNHTGQFFPMDVDPVLTGLVKGQKQAPEATWVDPSLYEDQAAEFAEVVNFRNEEGRQSFDLGDRNPEDLLAAKNASTYVVENLISAVIDLPLDQIDLSQQAASELMYMIDLDHYHFQIPGSFALQALENEHIAHQTIDPNSDYLLSVYDLRDYECAVIKDGVRDYFGRQPERQRLLNESIYVISEVEVNNEKDLASAERLFGKRPDAMLTQNVLYADHLIRGARTIFAFYAEGDKTRVVLLFNIAMGSQFFTGTQGAFIRQYLLDGVRTGIAGSVTGAVIDIKDGIADLISGADEHIRGRNACERGLSLGLIRYSHSLFNEFVTYSLED